MEQKNQNHLPALKEMVKNNSVKARFEEMLGKKSVGFLTSLTNIVQDNALLQKVPAGTIVLAAAQAAALDLPINPNLGYAAIIPYNTKNGTLAQFQVMRDGWVELAMRSGQVVALVNEPVYKGELVSANRFKDEYVFDETKRESNEIIGFMAYARLSNGFEKTVYWTVDQVKAHAQRYSQTYRKGYGVWKDEFIGMALKSVLKHLIKKYLPKSIEIQKALDTDQGAFTGTLEDSHVVYVDNDTSVEAQQVEEVSYEETEQTAENDTATVKEGTQQQTAEQTKTENYDF